MPSLIGQRIRDLRQQSGLTQTQLASGIVTPSMISQIEAGKAQPSQALLKKLAERLQAPPELLLDTPLDDNAVESRLEVIRTCVALKRYTEAEQLIDEVMTPSTGHPELYDLRGKVLLASRKFREAADAFHHAVALTREQGKFEYLPELYMMQGDIYMEASDHDTAIHLYEQALLALRAHVHVSGLLEAEISMRLSQAYRAAQQEETSWSFAQHAAERVAFGERSKEFAQSQLSQSLQALANGNTGYAKSLALEAKSLYDVFLWMETSLRSLLLSAHRLMERKEYDKARELLAVCQLRAQTHITEELRTELLLLESIQLIYDGRTDDALQRAQEALQIPGKSSKETVSDTIWASREAASAQRWDMALVLGQAACDSSRQLGDLTLIAESCQWLAELYMRDDKWNEAQQILTIIAATD